MSVGGDQVGPDERFKGISQRDAEGPQERSAGHTGIYDQGPDKNAGA